MDKYLNAIRQNVCSICVDSDEHCRCTLSSDESCAIEFYLPQIVEIVINSESEDIHSLHNKLHEKICVSCRNESSGNCYLRDDANCSIDRYFSLIVETIQKTSKGNN